jgi:hypothetical protein
MASFELSESLLLSGGLILMGFFLFIILYILIRLLFERHEHFNHNILEEEIKEDDKKEIP